MGWMVLALLGALATGLVGAAYFHAQPLENAETVFIFLAKVAFNPWVAGLLIAAILSAIMSTVDSQLLVSSSVISEDIYRPFIPPDASDKELMLVGRWAVIGIAVLALLIAQDPKSNILDLVGYAWAGFGAAFGPMILLSLYWNNYNKVGAIASILAGGITVVVWKQLSGGLFDLYEIVPGFILATLAGLLFSQLSGGASDETKEDFTQFERSL